MLTGVLLMLTHIPYSVPLHFIPCFFLITKTHRYHISNEYWVGLIVGCCNLQVIGLIMIMLDIFEHVFETIRIDTYHMPEPLVILRSS